jgi:hypothetical protein
MWYYSVFLISSYFLYETLIRTLDKRQSLSSVLASNNKSWRDRLSWRSATVKINTQLQGIH